MPKILFTQLLSVLVLTAAVSTLSAQKLDPDDRIGSAVGMCEGLRFERISGLLEAGKLTEKQAYERWKRISSDKVAVRALLDDAAKDGELTSAQVDHYHTEGYIAVPDFLSTEQVTTFLAEMDSISAGNTLADHDATRMEMEPNQPPEGTQVLSLIHI